MKIDKEDLVIIEKQIEEYTKQATRSDTFEKHPYTTKIFTAHSADKGVYGIIIQQSQQELNAKLMLNTLEFFTAYHFGCKPTLIINPTLLPQMNGLDNYYGYKVEYDSEMKEQGLIVVKED